MGSRRNGNSGEIRNGHERTEKGHTLDTISNCFEMHSTSISIWLRASSINVPLVSATRSSRLTSFRSSPVRFGSYRIPHQSSVLVKKKGREIRRGENINGRYGSPSTKAAPGESAPASCPHPWKGKSVISWGLVRMESRGEGVRAVGGRFGWEIVAGKNNDNITRHVRPGEGGGAYERFFPR